MYSRRSPGTAALCGLGPAGAGGPSLAGMAKPGAAGRTGGYSGPGTTCIPAMSMARARNHAQRRAVVPALGHTPGIGARGTVRSGGRTGAGGGTAQ